MKEFAVRFEKIYKEYPFYHVVTGGVKSFLFNLPRSLKSLKRSRLMALNDLSFEVKKGETFGIIGKNGSGKSTILSIIAGVIKQDRGHVHTNGKVSSLLELGAGFHPDLSGIENIILNGILLGNSKKDMIERLEDIISFSELGDFIYQPLRAYSSGMYVRLGFSVAIHTDPDILLIDEALAVGDIKFQEKCLEKISEVRKAGATTIIVSHDMSSLKELCDRVMWIEHGRLRMIGEPEEVIYAYIESLEERPSLQPPVIAPPEDNLPKEGEIAPPNKPVTWWDSGIVIDTTERFITKKGFKDFYDYLKRGRGLEGLSGLGVLNKLKHTKNEFIRSGICRSLKVIDGNDLYKESFDSYDLFISINLLGERDDLENIIKKIGEVIKDKGLIISLDKMDQIPYEPKELEIASRILRSIGFEEEIPETGYTKGKSLSRVLEKHFEIIELKYFGGPLYDIILNRVVNMEGLDKESLIKALITFEQIMLEEGILKGRYGMAIARKR